MFKSADVESLRKKHVVVIFKDKLDADELTPELQTYRKLRLCIQPEENIDKLIARIRYSILYDKPQCRESGFSGRRLYLYLICICNGKYDISIVVFNSCGVDIICF